MTFDRDRRPLRQRAVVVPLLLVMGWSLACGNLFGTPDTPDITKEADGKLKQGDLPGAKSLYEKARKDHADSVYAAEGLAYADLLEGKYDDAQKLLEDAEKYKLAIDDKKVMAELKLRRALIALKQGNLDLVKTYGEASGLPVGQVLAAEVHLADAESEDALKLLKTAANDQGIAGQTATQYISMLESEDPMNQGLAEATALWALGQRQVAVEAAEELVKALPEERDDKNALLLLWAGRAVTSDRPSIATGMLDAMGFPPEGQAWRIEATRAMISIAEGRNDEGLKKFQDLQTGGAPADGMLDALSTAAALAKDRDVARNLVAIAGQVESVAAARGLYQAGALQVAKKAANGSTFSQFMEVQ